MAGMSTRFFAPAAAICFVIAVLAFSGAVLRSDVVGRAIFGCAWTALGAVWLGHYIRRRRRRPS
jgi:H+/Cl- antiporter ClcA